MKAALTNYRQSPRKVRLVTDLVKGKSVEQAIALLTFSGKRAGDPIQKLIRSAIANAKINNKAEGELFIKEFRVDEGVTLKRSMPRARGSAFPIKKRQSHILLVLEERGGKVEPKEEKKATASVKKAEKAEKSITKKLKAKS
jgi:large subunit ribosomal protein L22